MVKKIASIVLLLVFCAACSKKQPTQFSKKALNDTFITTENQPITFQEILNKHRGKKVMIDVWASWCGDCIKGLPKEKEVQKQFPNADYVFLSLDKNQTDWIKGIEKFNIHGDHYFMKSGWKGAFGTFLNLDWIPRFLVLDEQGNIVLFKAIESKDPKIVTALQ